MCCYQSWLVEVSSLHSTNPIIWAGFYFVQQGHGAKRICMCDLRNVPSEARHSTTVSSWSSRAEYNYIRCGSFRQSHMHIPLRLRYEDIIKSAQLRGPHTSYPFATANNRNKKSRLSEKRRPIHYLNGCYFGLRIFSILSLRSCKWYFVMRSE